MPETMSSYSHYTEEELLKLAKQKNDQKAFDEIYYRCKPALIDNAYKKLQSRESAEDLVHDIFLSLYTKTEVLEFTVSLKAYLHTALKYKVQNELRNKMVRERHKRFLFFSPNCKNDFASNLEYSECKKRVDSTIASLPYKCRQVFMMSREYDYSYKDISGNLGISVSTVEKHISKALKVLRDNVL
ncbi:RNA polymerase sigma-70 factor [Ilyomonas limi]|uniref:RNA polymerase sigma-70 factor n=1 Tax=Ilyomonas limi TaxID=2575867 RepID=A0A4U3L332_9BACT|nr:RNA polymerase sigma-70 factor [Ilyomonas limi]TKK67947.1 RNA polymerase sigma-70 factor [Ilyomonas limi]